MQPVSPSAAPWNRGRAAGSARRQPAGRAGRVIAVSPAPRLLVSTARTPDGTPPSLTKPDELSWHQYAVMLLRVAAEIEHALMVQYLYAAYSLEPVVGTADFPRAHGWQQALLTVAREEMGHLLTMQNALDLVGGPANFDRCDFPWDGPFFPFPLELEPVSALSLAKYVFAEMDPSLEGPPPARFSTEREAAWYHDRDRVFSQVRSQLRPGQAPHHVADLFHVIAALLADPALAPDSWFEPETFARQSSWDEWGKGFRPHPLDGELQDAPRAPNVIVARAGTRTELLDALGQVATQGEAPNLEQPTVDVPSHFDRFFEVYAEVAAEGDRLAEHLRSIPVNPSTDDADAGGDVPGAYIQHPTSRTLGQLSNLRYRMLLTNLAHGRRCAGGRSGAERAAHGFLMQRSFADMFNVKTLAGQLFRAPLTDTPGDAARAGPPFEMPYTTELPTTDADCWHLQRDLLEQSTVLCTALLDGGDAPAGSVRYLTTLVELDRADAERISAMLGRVSR